jgi:hypothetical protein
MIPATDRPVEAPIHVADKAPRHRGATVLAVDDEDAMREVTRILASQGTLSQA